VAWLTAQPGDDGQALLDPLFASLDRVDPEIAREARLLYNRATEMRSDAIAIAIALPCLALPCLALPCLALPCLALPCLASRADGALAAAGAGTRRLAERRGRAPMALCRPCSSSRRRSCAW
jgi:hypothetical protein